MGSIWFPKYDLGGFLTDLAGYKCGIALTRNALIDVLQGEEGIRNFLSTKEDKVIRIRSEELEQIAATMLYNLGQLESPSIVPEYISIFHKLKKDPISLRLYTNVMETVLDLSNRDANDFVRSGINIEKAIAYVSDLEIYFPHIKFKYGEDGLKMAVAINEAFKKERFRSPLSDFRSVHWENTVELEDIFNSESLITLYGTFFDQRYIDFIERNFDFIDNINWRKFEGFTGEYFVRNGFEVELGPGRDDDGVDIRVWPDGKDKTLPPLMLIQCKRQKKKIEKVIVKALWADVMDEKADSGLIVTTSCLSPGAQKVCTARGYNIEQANRDTLKKWLKQMRTPGEGFFLST